MNRTDDQGTFWDTLLDVGCALYSAWQVVTNPSPDNWLALGADVACIVVPFASGGGAAVRATAKYGDDVLSAAKAGDNVADAGKNLNRLENAGNVAYDVGHAAGNTAMSPALCFIEGTLVLTDEGLKEIEEVKEGDKVWAENPETGEKSLKNVVQTFINETDELVHVYAGDEKISATPEHPFYVRDRGWTGAIDLRAGDILVLQDGGYVIVEKTQHEILEKPVKVYNFEVEDFHTYYVGADSVLVHNMCAVKFEGDTRAFFEIVKEAEQTGIDSIDAEILWDWTKEMGFDAYRNSHSAKFDKYQGGKQFHMKIYGKHINIF